jgi:hypothetical protein
VRFSWLFFQFHLKYVPLRIVTSSNGLLNAEAVSEIPEKKLGKKFCFELWITQGGESKNIVFQASNTRDHRRWAQALVSNLQTLEEMSKIIGKGKKR